MIAFIDDYRDAYAPAPNMLWVSDFIRSLFPRHSAGKGATKSKRRAIIRSECTNSILT